MDRHHSLSIVATKLPIATVGRQIIPGMSDKSLCAKRICAKESQLLHLTAPALSECSTTIGLGHLKLGPMQTR
jgi:hypothetical protein